MLWTLVKSPHIDRLAEQGTLFERAYCQQAVCNPSRSSLLTGLRPETLGICTLPPHFREKFPQLVSLPQHFKQNGYFAQNIGKIFHNFRQDKFKGDPDSWSVPAVMHYGSHGEDIPKIKGKLPPELSGVPRTEMYDVPDDAYFDGRIADLAVEALQQCKSRSEPFFLAVGFWKPHAPFNAPKKYWDMYDRAEISSPAPALPPENVPEIAMHDSREILRGFKARKDGRPTADEVLALRHGYYAAISYVDEQIGRVLAELERLKLNENTIVVFWSDHGFHLGEHTLWAKTSNFELDARVPMLIRLPNQKTAQRSSAIVELLDLYPTLIDLCGLPAPGHQLEGISLRPLLEGGTTPLKTAALTQHPRPAYPAAGAQPEAMGYSIRSTDFRYTEWRTYDTDQLIAVELYDHRSDPRETKNLANLSEKSDVRTTLSRELSQLRIRSQNSIPGQN